MRRMIIIVAVAIFVLGGCGALIEIGAVVYAVTHTHQIASAAGSLAGIADKAFEGARK